MPSAPITRPDFSGMADGIAEEVHRQGELCLSGTIQLAIAADQRATVMAGMYGAAAVALLGAVAAVLAGATPSWSFVAGASIASFFLFAAAVLCALSAQPTDFYVAGYEPKKVAGAEGGRPWFFKAVAEDVQVRIEKNRATLETAARHVSHGSLLALLATPLGAAAFVIVDLAR